jgi:PAS domain-containing protein
VFEGATISPGIAFFLGFSTAAAVGGAVAYWLVRRLNRAETQRRRARREAELAAEILSHGPDGLFVWDHRSHATRASHRLAVLLDLDAGAEARFDDVLARFSGDPAGQLGKAVVDLRSHGTPFDLILSRGERLIQAVGVRVGDAKGAPLADILWMRDVTGSPGAEAQAEASAGERAAGDSRFQSLLEALPLPVWLRDAEMNLTFVNRAGVSVAVAEPTRTLAARATAGGQALTERHLLALGGAPRLIDVTESPLRGGSGTLGFAVDQSEAEEREGEFAREASAQAQVLEGLETGIAVFDADAVLKSYNGAYADILHLDTGWLDTRPTLSEILDRLRDGRRLPEEADFRAFKDALLARFGGPADETVELQHLPDGDTLKVAIRPHPLGGLTFTYADVTDALALERAVNTQAAVQRETVDSLFEGVAVIGSDGRLRLANPAFKELWRLSDAQAEAGPHAAQLVEHMRPLLEAPDAKLEDWDACKERTAARLLGRTASAGRITLADGHVLDYANVPLPDGSMLVHYQDAPETDAAVAFSHRARTALTVIIGYAELLKDSPKSRLTKKQKEQCDAIAAAGRLLLADAFRLAGLDPDEHPETVPEEGDLFNGL